LGDVACSLFPSNQASVLGSLLFPVGILPIQNRVFCLDVPLSPPIVLEDDIRRPGRNVWEISRRRHSCYRRVMCGLCILCRKVRSDCIFVQRFCHLALQSINSRKLFSVAFCSNLIGLPGKDPVSQPLRPALIAWNTTLLRSGFPKDHHTSAFGNRLFTLLSRHDTHSDFNLCEICILILCVCFLGWRSSKAKAIKFSIGSEDSTNNYEVLIAQAEGLVPSFLPSIDR